MDKVAIYCRLSKEDQDKLEKGDDSASIQNQKMMLVDYATSHEMQIYKIYTDDDFTGSDITRPSWNNMLSDAELGKFNIILCKAQSRFARSLEVVEKYINGVFVEWGIRFISVVDNIDTNIKSSKKTSQINGLIDQWYLEDLSENIKRTYRQKMIASQYLGAFAPYGYMKNPQDKYKLIIDEEAANIVRLIFDLNLQGYGVNIISQKLTEMDIPTPTEYKKSKGMNFYNPNSQMYSQRGIWGFTTLKRILNNPVYIGTLIQGKEKKVSYKSKKIIPAPKDEWVIIENNHDPIVSKEIYEKTQELLQIRRKTCKTTSGKKFQPHLFSGRIKCADCKSTMAKTSGRLAGGHDYFICQLAKKTKYEKCTRHSIRYDEVVKVVDNEIKNMMNFSIENNNNLDKLRSVFKKDNSNKNKISEMTKLINKLDTKVKDSNKTITNLYMDKVKNIITEDEFIIIKNSLTEETKLIETQLNNAKKEIDKLNQTDSKINSFIESVDRHVDYNELTFEIVNDFIICIYIHETDISGKQEIEIEWNI